MATKVENGKPAEERKYTLNEAMDIEFIRNAMTSRSELFKHWMDPRRSIDDECGYPTTEEIDVERYKHLYDREPIATRVVNVLPEECWRSTPEVVETQDSEEETAFELGWKELGKQLFGGSWFEDTEGSNPIWEFLERADKLSGIGHYGVILLGFDDVKQDTDLTKPVKLSDTGGEQQRKLLFIRVLDEQLAQIAGYEKDRSNPNYGRPNLYNLSLNDDQLGSLVSRAYNAQVHWSRIVHIADNLDSSEIIGVPRQRPVLNRILDLYKMYGGSAEMYWRGAFPGLAIESQPQVTGKAHFDVEGFKDQMENYQNSLQRYLALMGVTVKTLAPTVVDPASQIDALIQAICIKLAVPMRIFMGSERGELASSQDSDSWENRLQRRRIKYITPRIIVPFVDRLIRAGVLPVPERYSVAWSAEDTTGEVEKADVLTKRTAAFVAYVSGGAEALIPPLDYLTREAGYSEEDAEAVLESAMEHMEEVEEKEAEQQQEQMDMQMEQQIEVAKAMPAPQQAPPGAAPAKPGFPPKAGPPPAAKKPPFPPKK